MYQKNILSMQFWEIQQPKYKTWKVHRIKHTKLNTNRVFCIVKLVNDYKEKYLKTNDDCWISRIAREEINFFQLNRIDFAIVQIIFIVHDRREYRLFWTIFSFINFSTWKTLFSFVAECLIIFSCLDFLYEWKYGPQ